jgi:hypothetical protein
MAGVSEKDKKDTRAFLALNQLFHVRLVDACKKAGDTPDFMDPAVFIALPERLMARTAHLCVDKSRRLGDLESTLTPSMLECLTSYAGEEKDAQFINFDSAVKTEAVRNVLLCHGLSPVGDSIQHAILGGLFGFQRRWGWGCR